jgi:hypothetical protein
MPADQFPVQMVTYWAMALPILTLSTVMVCPHGGSVRATAGSQRLLVDGSPVLRVSDSFIVSECPFIDPTGNPSPCVTVQWPVGSSTVLVEGTPALDVSSTSVCEGADGSLRGPVAITSSQSRVEG